VHTTSRYGDVNVTISGSAEDPEVALSADEYDDTDILFLLLFGKPASEMSEGESGAGSLLLTTAVASLSGQVSRAVGGTLIDEFDWDPESGVRVGKALSEKLFIAYDRNTNPEDDENINQITLEWIITRRMYAQFMTGDMAQSSADLYWRWLF
jgi:autotransporter translocation and assembly factor TamB